MLDIVIAIVQFMNLLVLVFFIYTLYVFTTYINGRKRADETLNKKLDRIALLLEQVTTPQEAPPPPPSPKKAEQEFIDYDVYYLERDRNGEVSEPELVTTIASEDLNQAVRYLKTRASYPDDARIEVDGLRANITWFINSGKVECIYRLVPRTR